MKVFISDVVKRMANSGEKETELKEDQSILFVVGNVTIEVTPEGDGLKLYKSSTGAEEDVINITAGGRNILYIK